LVTWATLLFSRDFDALATGRDFHATKQHRLDFQVLK
jgi:hypothetical protein